MTKPYKFVLASFVLTLGAAMTRGQSSGGPETVLVHSGSATLHAMLWRPQGRGPFPVILLNHGSGRTREALERLGSYEGFAFLKRGTRHATRGRCALQFYWVISEDLDLILGVGRWET